MKTAEGVPHEKGGTHISGAEHIVDEEQLIQLANEMIFRALNHRKGKIDFINITIDTVQNESITYVDAPKIITHPVESVDEGHALGKDLLELLVLIK